MFDFDDMGYVDFMIDFVFALGTPILALDMQTFPNQLEYAFLYPNESSSLVIAFDLERTKRKYSLTCLRRIRKPYNGPQVTYNALSVQYDNTRFI